MTFKINTIIFDIGGVLIQDPQCKEFWNNMEGSKQLRILFGMGKISEEEFIKRGSKILNLSQKEFYEKYKENY